MSNKEFDLARDLFRQKGVSTLLSQFSEAEKLSPEAEELLVDIGSDLLIQITTQSCQAAVSRGSKTLAASDVKFAGNRFNDS